ncbi:microsomal glutathione S-transferase 1 [Cylas formicarius]|uniref:microsomal glutathione S-transferase 1 n=1 Tax=Cylas formicarius TaxID=197179 RepID=UPI0029589F94|nr:microsomal glutathione S-transferase 1 [Cylas formicarius]
MAPSVFDVNNPLIQTYFFYGSILVLKVIAMSFLTARQRFKAKAFANPEDTKTLPNAKVKVDENVERVRRAHLNDLENIPIFFVASFAYISTNPSVWLATNLIRAFTIARFVHTFVYAVQVVPQPSRALAFGVGVLVTVYMAVTSILYYL